MGELIAWTDYNLLPGSWERPWPTTGRLIVIERMRVSGRDEEKGRKKWGLEREEREI